MRFPSVQVAFGAAAATLRRHPFVLACAVVAAAAGFALVDRPQDESVPVRLLLAATLGLPALVALDTLGFRRPGSPLFRFVLPSVGALLVVAFFFAADPWADPVRLRRWAQLNLAAHALVAVLAYAGRGEPNGFWQFNRRLFERFLVSALFSAVLFLGLALAIAAVDQLFGVDVDDEHYARLWFTIAFVFNTWYFLGGLPRPLEDLDRSQDYPAGLKVFSQYILVPLVLVYLVILTAYLGRVALTREWPSGWIGWLVSGVSILGILALLLVHPVRLRPENRWVGTFARGFWFALLPALAMLFLAIGKRVDQYGVTENRYFLCAFAVWLTGLSVFFVLRRHGSIAVIPWSLAAIAVVTSGGPWGAYAVARNSQTARLAEILARNDLLVDGRARIATDDVSFEDRREISATLRYLVDHHGTASIDGWFAGSPDAADDGGDGDDAHRFMSRLELEWVDRWVRGPEDRFSFHATAMPAVVDVREWDYVIALHGAAPREAPQPAETTERFRATSDEGATEVVVWDGDARLIALPLDELVKRARERARTSASGPSLPPDALRIERARNGVRVALQLQWVNGEESADGDRVNGLDGNVYLDLP